MNTDNHEETRIAVGNYIRNNAPRGLNEVAKRRVFEKDTRASLTFERANGRADCKLYVEFVYEGLSEGFEEYSVQAKINWSSYGETSPSLALTRIELMREVTLFAAEIEAAFSKPVWRARS